jgi:hypothetical protein
MASASAAHAPVANGNGKHGCDGGGHVDEASLRFASLAIHGGQRPDPVTGAIMPPISVSSTYVQVGAEMELQAAFFSRFVPRVFGGWLC